MQDNRILNLILHILQVFMQMCVAVCVTNLILHGFMHYETFQVWNTLCIGPVVAVYYLAKSFVKHGKVATLLHVAAAGSVLYLVQGTTEDKVLVLLPAIGFMYYSLKRRTEKPFIQLDLGILVACYVAGTTMSAESGTVLPLYATFIYMAAYFIWYNIEHLNKMVLENGSVKSFNAEQAINVNSIMLTIFVIVSLAVMFILPNLQLQRLVYAVLLAMWRVALIGIQALHVYMPKGGYELEQSLEHRVEHYDDAPMALEMTEGNDILDMIAVVFAGVIFVFMMVLVVRALRNLRYHKSQGNDVKEFVRPTLGKKNSRSGEKRKLLDLRGSNDQVARKLYKNIIKKNLNKGQQVKVQQAPYEISEHIMGLTESTKQVTDIYEKARYSNEEISKEEVKLLQDYYKEKK